MAEDGPLEFELRHRIDANAEAVRSSLLEIDTQLIDRGLFLSDRSLTHLLLAEALNNIVEHAYAGSNGAIELRIAGRRGALDISLMDKGRAMPGLSMPAGTRPRVDVTLQALPEGGWGWQILRSLAQNLAYVRNGQINRLTFAVNLSDA